MRSEIAHTARRLEAFRALLDVDDVDEGLPPVGTVTVTRRLP
jgi:hypothetical protein